MHVWDYMTPVEGVIRGLDDLVRQVKVHYVAFSDSPGWIVAEANARAELMGWTQIVGVQVLYSLLRRDVERAILPMARHWNIAFMPWGLLNRGIMTGKFMSAVKEDTRINPEKVKLNDQALAVVREVQKIAGEVDRPVSQVAVNWVRHQQSKAQMVPILGARNKMQLKENLGALEWKLSDDQLKRLDGVCAIERGFPHDFIDGNRYVFGATFDQIDTQYRETCKLRMLTIEFDES